MQMRSRAPISLAAALLSTLTFAAWPASSAASSSPGQAPCTNPEFSCATLPVPLDRTAPVPGTISLHVARKLAGATPSRVAVLALAGGPGQAALPLSEFIASAIAPALSTRDLLVFDQRGTGRSDPLNCPIFSDQLALEDAATPSTFSALVEQCALQIGPSRGAYTTAESVEDIEAIRLAYGYEKLVLYGTSYGTKVALQYAERYPQYVEALVLDSVVPPRGREPFGVPSFQAVGPVLDELCSNHACAGITSNPLADLARLNARLRKRALSGSAYDGAGHRHAVSMGELGLWGLLGAGDLDPALRALLPAAVRSALDNDPDPLLRLYLIAQGFIPSLPAGPIDPEAEQTALEEENNALYYATTCEETAFPWQRPAPPATRSEEALAALRAIPSSAFYPFDATIALMAEPTLECERWPDAAPAPSPLGPLPDVPTLILSGAQDLRTPTSYARGVAAEIPGAQLLVVPYTGHSVLGSDLSGCADAAVSAFFAGNAVQPCPPGPNPFAPTPIAPTELARVQPPPGLGGNPGRTLTAALDALVDLNRLVIAATIQADQALPSGSSFGGLRGGYARLTSSAAVLKDFSFVPGVALSGTFPVKEGKLQAATMRVSGSSASPGTIRVGSSEKQIAGTLGGRRFSVSLADVKLSSVGGGFAQWPTQPPILRGLARRESAGLRGRAVTAGLP
jgi:pimeloyl-ACP methyl ester carboxylesterase